MSKSAMVIERDFRIFFADKYMLVIMFVNFMIDLGVSGLSLGAMIRNLGFSYFLYIAPGANLITATVAAFQSGRDVWRERVIQDTQQYLLTLPVRKNVFALSRLFSGMLRTVLTVLPGTMVIALLYNLSVGYFLVGLLIMFIYSGAVAGLSVAAASLANSLELFATVRSTAQVYLSFFSTQFYPSNILPPAVAAVSAFNPMTWAVQSFRALQAGTVDLALLIPLSGLSAALLGAGFFMYRRTMNY
ncbi:MAG TPA: ABC transporter permease [Nitrososphaerales archaeon]|nr:ABC transporter permease [Nitrososphaerales archaeon]